MSDFKDVWNNRVSMVDNTLANSSFPRNQLGPSYAPYTPSQLTGIYSGQVQSNLPQPTNEFITSLFTNSYFLKLLGEFIVTNGLNVSNTTETFSNKNDIYRNPWFDIGFKVFVVVAILILLLKRG